MDDQNKNLILAIVLSTVVMGVWMFFFAPEPPLTPPPSEQTTQQATAPTAAQPTVAGDTTSAPSGVANSDVAAPSDLIDAPRFAIETPSLTGSVSLLGGRIDDLLLNGYSETLDANSPNVTLLRPATEQEGYFALFGWAPGGDLDFADVPGPSTVWTIASGSTLTPDTPVTLEWRNTKGHIFRRTLAVDARNMFTVTQQVENTSAAAIRVAPYSELVREGEPSDLKGFFVVHEGAIRQTGEALEELSYDDMTDFDTDPRWGANASVVKVEQNGWVGFTDHYWMTALIPAADTPFESVLRYEAQSDRYTSIARLNTLDVAPGASAKSTMRLFAGAKVSEVLDVYQEEGGVYKFYDSIDWGWFFFLTKPIFKLLHFLNGFIGNMGWSIIALTLMIKAVLFPLAYKSYVSMAKMKELQPEMEKIKEKAGDDRQKLQQEMMQLYKKEKVNPASGCLPIILQIPIFFSLYKVIFVTIELRHAPWFGWIRDLSMPDPSSIINLFGILPYDVPELGALQILSLGILPILLGISMWLQQKLNPSPTDATQAMIFAWMPWVFMFMLGSFASGLVVYWIANNTITFSQQYLIMRSQGFKPDVFGNIKSSFKRKKPDPK